MGVVYQAVDVSGDRFVALKMLSSALSGDLVALLRFKREARTASSLSHPNICAVYDFGESRGRPFIVMELLEGQTLKERLAQGSCDPLLVLDVAMQVAEGLGAAHTKFIVHRDIKPANIFLVNGGAVKILDFGIAKHFVRLETDSAPTVTKEGNTPGTVDYMSPEQLLGQRIDQRSDLFSLGVSLYEVLTSRTPVLRQDQARDDGGDPASQPGAVARDPAPRRVVTHTGAAAAKECRRPLSQRRCARRRPRPAQAGCHRAPRVVANAHGNPRRRCACHPLPSSHSRSQATRPSPTRSSATKQSPTTSSPTSPRATSGGASSSTSAMA